METPDATLGSPSALARLSARDASVLDELARADDALLAFQGLRRRLGVHQQALTRSLRRLEQDGFVERTQSGYRLSDRGYQSLRDRAPAGPAAAPLTLAKALLPPRLGADAIVRQLAHRWFRGLRWYGLSESPGETRLVWLLEPGDGQVRVRVAAGHFVIEADAVPDDPKRPFEAARGLLGALAELYGLAPAPDEPIVAAATFRPGTAA